MEHVQFGTVEFGSVALSDGEVLGSVVCGMSVGELLSTLIGDTFLLPVTTPYHVVYSL